MAQALSECSFRFFLPFHAASSHRALVFVCRLIGGLVAKERDRLFGHMKTFLRLIVIVYVYDRLFCARIMKIYATNNLRVEAWVSLLTWNVHEQHSALCMMFTRILSLVFKIAQDSLVHRSNPCSYFRAAKSWNFNRWHLAWAWTGFFDSLAGFALWCIWNM